MEPRDLWRLFLRRLLLIVVVGVVGLGAATGVVLTQKPVYQATARVFVSIRSVSNVQDLSSGSTFVQQIVKSYAEVATSPLVLQPVIDDLGLTVSPAQLAKSVTATASLDTVVIDLSADDRSPTEAVKIAAAVSKQLSDKVDTVTAVRANGALVNLTQIQPAALDPGVVSPKPVVLLPIGLIGGLLIGAIAAIVIEGGTRRVYSTGDAARAAQVEALGGLMRSSRRTPVVAGERGADAYRALRANLTAALPEGATSVLVTGPARGAGASTTAANLGIAIAEGGARVALVEANLRHSSLAHFLELAPAAGLGDVLAGHATIDAALLAWGDHGLQVVAAGIAPVNASDLLQGDPMRQAMTELHDRFDIVIYDGPALLESSDAPVLGSRVDGVVVVAARGRTGVRTLREAVHALTRLGGTAAGVVVTRLPRTGPDAPTVRT